MIKLTAHPGSSGKRIFEFLPENPGFRTMVMENFHQFSGENSLNDRFEHRLLSIAEFLTAQETIFRSLATFETS